MADEQKIEKILCPTCKVQTKHLRIWAGPIKLDEFDGIWEEEYFELFHCMGCETPTLKKTYRFSEDMEPVYNEDGNVKRNEAGHEVWDVVPKITLWPKRKAQLKQTKNFFDIPPRVKRIYSETIDSFNEGLYILSAIGIRAIIEVVCLEEGISADDLKCKIEKLYEKGVIPKKVSDALQENRILGNQSAHEVKQFSEDTIDLGIDLVESMLDFHYNSETRAHLIKSKLNDS
jgi:hypothetical protein